MGRASHGFTCIRFYATGSSHGERSAAADQLSAAGERGSVEPLWQDG